MNYGNLRYGPLDAVADRIGHDGRLPEDTDSTDLVNAVLARSTPAGVYLTQGARWLLPEDHPVRRVMYRPGWDWGRDAYPSLQAWAPTPQNLRTCPVYWINGPGRDLAARTLCGHEGGYRLTNSCLACEEANEALEGADPDATTGPLVLSALVHLDAQVSSEGDCAMVDLGEVRIEIADTLSARIDYPAGQHRGFCAQLVQQDNPDRHYLIYASADHNARRDVHHLAHAVTAEANSRRLTRR